MASVPACLVHLIAHIKKARCFSRVELQLWGYFWSFEGDVNGLNVFIFDTKYSLIFWNSGVGCCSH